MTREKVQPQVGQIWQDRKKASRFIEIQDVCLDSITARDVDSGKPRAYTAEALQKLFKPTGSAVSGNGNGDSYPHQEPDADSSPALAPLVVTPKKEFRVACPCDETLIFDEVQSWDEIVERVERFRDRHHACLTKTVLPFGAELTPQEEATR